MGDTVKTLVAYYSWSGATKKAARQIADTIQADMMELVPKKAYPKSYGLTALKSLLEQVRGARPKLENRMSDFSNYDRVIIGFPIWWYNCPMLICSFLEQYDFTGKQVYTFCTHGGSGPSKSSSTLRKVCGKDDMPDCLDANSLTRQKITDWIGK